MTMGSQWKVCLEVLALALVVVLLFEPEAVLSPFKVWRSSGSGGVEEGSVSGPHTSLGLSTTTLAVIAAQGKSSQDFVALGDERRFTVLQNSFGLNCTNSTDLNCTTFASPNVYQIIFPLDCTQFNRNSALAAVSAAANVPVQTLQFISSTCGSVQMLFTCLSTTSALAADQTCGQVTATACAQQILGATACGVLPTTTTTTTSTAGTTTTTTIFLARNGPDTQGGLYGLFGLFGLPLLIGLGFLVWWCMSRKSASPVVVQETVYCTAAPVYPSVVVPQATPYYPTVDPYYYPTAAAAPVGSASVVVVPAAPEAFAAPSVVDIAPMAPSYSAPVAAPYNYAYSYAATNTAAAAPLYPAGGLNSFVY